MNNVTIGLSWCLLFVTLEAVQAVYFGATFQRVDSFLVAVAVFGTTTALSLAATLIRRPRELAAAFRSPGILAIMNVSAAIAWITYFLSIQLVEPAVVFAVFSGCVPLATVAASKRGMREAGSGCNRMAAAGMCLIALSIGWLATITLAGESGFLRGGLGHGVAGIALAALSGTLTAVIVLYSTRLNARGVGPLAQFGLRFLLYVPICGIGLWLGVDDKGVETGAGDLAVIWLIGLIAIALPLYAVQRAVPLVSATVIAAFTALGPVAAFGLQVFDARVAYAPMTLCGLTIYMFGALVAALGSIGRVRLKGAS
ncbi:hypothetical protein [Chelativorans xinjiangense]|uniref:hypothetical protein n=1 Tax=Chelativorans xinjiangense TaxID=2681485 RepID=UPI0013587671|nr:hypothetical protein [Chelativorans xinjiangense]